MFNHVAHSYDACNDAVRVGLRGGTRCRRRWDSAVDGRPWLRSPENLRVSETTRQDSAFGERELADAGCHVMAGGPDLR